MIKDSQLPLIPLDGPSDQQPPTLPATPQLLIAVAELILQVLTSEDTNAHNEMTQ